MPIRSRTPAMVRERMRIWNNPGINTLRVYPGSDSPETRLDTLVYTGRSSSAV